MAVTPPLGVLEPALAEWDQQLEIVPGAKLIPVQRGIYAPRPSLGTFDAALCVARVACHE